MQALCVAPQTEIPAYLLSVDKPQPKDEPTHIVLAGAAVVPLRRREGHVLGLASDPFRRSWELFWWVILSSLAQSLLPWSNYYWLYWIGASQHNNKLGLVDAIQWVFSEETITLLERRTWHKVIPLTLISLWTFSVLIPRGPKPAICHIRTPHTRRATITFMQ